MTPPRLGPHGEGWVLGQGIHERHPGYDRYRRHTRRFLPLLY